MPRRIYKYATGDAPPEGAQYLGTVTQTSVDTPQGRLSCWLVWHYFLVEVES